MKTYKDDGSAWMVYARALAAFRAEGDSATARKRLAAAREANGHAPEYLLGRKKLPRSTPDYRGFGDDSEAICFMADGAAAWHTTPGAVAWLAATETRTVEQAKTHIRKNLGKSMEKPGE